MVSIISYNVVGLHCGCAGLSPLYSCKVLPEKNCRVYCGLAFEKVSFSYIRLGTHDLCKQTGWQIKHL